MVLPVRAAVSVLGRAAREDDAHASVRLLAGAALLGLRIVAAGRMQPAESGGMWVPTRLVPADAAQVDALARAHGGEDPDAAAEVVRRLVAAVVDSVPRSAPPPGRARPRPEFAPTLQQRLARRQEQPGEADLPQLVTLALRVEADEDELLAGTVRVVLQVRDERDPLHVCDAAVLFTESAAVHGFGGRARVHASMALRRAAEAWPVLDRLQALRVPDEITLDGLELESLLGDGVAALAAVGVDVLWPRTLSRELTTRAVLDRSPAGGDDLLETGMFGPDAMFAFRWEAALHGEALTAEEVEQLTKAAAPVLKLRGQWVVIAPEVARRARKRLAAKVTPAQALAATLTGTVEADDAPAEVHVGASLLRVREQLRAAATREPVDIPPALQATLRDYQRHGLTWLAELTGLGLGACLADDMGLGKTITLIALHLHRAAEGRGGPTLVVCPTSLLGNWEAEIRRFAPDEPVRRFHGPAKDLEGVTGGFVLTTYGTVRTSASALGGVAWDLVVADEAQHVKNAQSATARALRTISSRARVALTGTPVENNLTELWAILDWAIPGLLGSRNAFRKVWAAPIEAGVDPARTRQFADLIGPFLLRRRKTDPGIAPELPPKTETDHPLGLTREQVVLYQAFVRDTMERIERAEPEARRGLVLALLTGLKQICNHPAQFLKQANPRLAGRSHKLDLLDELLDTVLAEDGAVLVFTQYVALAHLLERHLAARQVPHQLLHGGTPVREREAMVRRFQDGEVPVFLLSLKAGGTGLNLTRADHVIHVDRWWNPAVEAQATDRAHRIGQTRPVQVHRFVTQGTIEQRIAELLARKSALADAVLGSGDVALTELSDAELRDLVTLDEDAEW